MKGFSEADREDIEQDLALHAWRQRPKYDASRASQRTFANRVVMNKVVNMIEARQAEKRDVAAVPEINPEVPGDAQVLDVSDLRERTRREEADEALRKAVARVVADLPERLRALSLHLMDGTMSEVSREAGIPRTTLYDDRKSIREIFERAGLRAYLGTDVFRACPVRTGRRKP